ncbi:MAG: hypothetical protein HQL75_08345 [Magnetococcales bacterium]|nr:hypothetical protein [Magnetococcales bacterium]
MKKWSIGIYHGNSPLDFSPLAGVVNPVLTAQSVTDMHALFVADPFMVCHEGRWLMFFEAWNRDRGMGEICLATSHDGKIWNYDQRVLWENHHLSYPSVFQWQGAWYLLPESRAAHAVTLYKAKNFPYEWTRAETLLVGDFADPTLFFHNNRFWMFVLEGKDSLALFFSDTLLHGWTAHPCNPLIHRDPGRSRPGGRVVIDGERIIRYAQDNRILYGQQIFPYEIKELSTTAYREEQADTRPILFPTGDGWNGIAMHHLDPHLLDNGHWLACVDGAGLPEQKSDVDHLFPDWKIEVAFADPSRPTVLFYCQHLIGLGHFTRSLALGQALRTQFNVVLLSGGTPPTDFQAPPGLNFVQLPPLANQSKPMGQTFCTGLESDDQTLSVDEVLALRKKILLDIWDRLLPQVLIIEHFPFGRRSLEPELFPLLERAKKTEKNKPLVLSSIRDILGQGMDYRWPMVLANKMFDGVLVHSDPTCPLPTLALDGPVLSLNIPLYQTGFVVSEKNIPPTLSHTVSRIQRDGPIVVTAGGGRNGGPLYRAALAVQKTWAAERGFKMRIICGPFFPEEAWVALTREGQGVAGLRIDRWENSMASALENACLAVAFFGYNTAMDLLRSGTPALVVPYVAENDFEQLERAKWWQKKGAIRMLHPDALTPSRLITEIQQTLVFEPVPPRMDRNGAMNTVNLVAHLLSGEKP